MDGYNRIAGHMGANPKLSIFRRFGAMSARDLLVMQAELAHIEDDYLALIVEDSRSSDSETKAFEYNILALKEAESQSPAGLQWKRMLQVRKMLKQYRAAIIQDHAVANLPRPDHSSYDALNAIVRSCNGGHSFLIGPEASQWSEENFGDQIALRASGIEDDRLSRWLNESVLPWYHKVVPRRKRKPIMVSGPWSGGDQCVRVYEYDDSSLANIAKVIVAALASMLPVASTFVLYFVKNPVVQMGAVSALTFVFGATLMMVTSAKGSEYFAATAAFSAGLVVFIGGNGIHDSCTCA